jgi:RES domain-containing protein
MIAEPDLSACLRALPGASLASQGGPWARAVALRHIQQAPPGSPTGAKPEPLWPGGSSLAGARFTPKGGTPLLYLASDAVTALAEMQAVLEIGGKYTYQQHDPYGVFCVDGVLDHLLDLTSQDVRDLLELQESELLGPWKRAMVRAQKGKGPLPATQLLGQALAAIPEIAGVRYPSAKLMEDHAPGVNVAVFIDRLTGSGGTWLSIRTTDGLYEQSLPRAMSSRHP